MDGRRRFEWLRQDVRVEREALEEFDCWDNLLMVMSNESEFVWNTLHFLPFIVRYLVRLACVALGSLNTFY